MDPARSRQDDALSAPVFVPLLQRLRTGTDALVAEVAGDVAVPGEDGAAVVAAVAPVVTWMLDALSESDRLRDDRLTALSDEGARAALGGESLQRLLDRYLSTGWVLWGAATHADVDAPTLAALGTALLKAGDAAAAAIANGYGAQERAIALRAAGARRDLIDDLLDLRPGDAEAAAHVRRRAAELGLEAGATYRLVVAALSEDVADGGPELAAVSAALAPPDRSLPRRSESRGSVASAPIVAGRRGRVVLLVPGDRPVGPEIAAALDLVAMGQWLGVASAPVAGLTHVAAAYADAIDALGVARRLGRTGLVDADDVLLERALLADEGLLAAAVERELGPILRANRNASALLRTLEAYLESAENLRATARRLGIAPRTVAYRLERIEALLGGEVSGPRLIRLATALLAERLVNPAPDAPLATAPADRSRRAPRGRSRARPRRATAR